MTEEQFETLKQRLKQYDLASATATYSARLSSAFQRGDHQEWYSLINRLFNEGRFEEHHLHAMASALLPVFQQFETEAKRTMEEIEVTA